jgi:GWxTD domain-containing protein
LTLLNDKRKFLFEFWKKRNTNPSTPERHTRAAFRALAEDANREFRSMYKEGWKTDRGRVYLTYGKPDDVERYPNSAEYAPYEVWTYNNIDNLQSGVIFVFGDLYGTNIYRLVHSTHQAEVRNEYWMNELKKQ